MFALLRNAWGRLVSRSQHHSATSQARAVSWPIAVNAPPLLLAGGKYPYGLFDASAFEDALIHAVPAAVSASGAKYVVATLHLRDSDRSELRAARVCIEGTLVGHLTPALTARFKIGTQRDEMDMLSSFSVNARVRRVMCINGELHYDIRIDLYEDWVGLPADHEAGPTPAPSTRAGSSSM